MSITQFPSEVLENIFIFLDGLTLCLSRQVCKAWNEVIKKMQMKRTVWKQFCIREISKNVLEEILGFKSIPSLTDIDWINIYKKWFNSRIISKLPYYKKMIQAYKPESLDVGYNQHPITCVRLSGSWVITGHSNGLLCVWNLLTGDLHQNFMCHLKIINDIALVDLLNLGSYYGSEELPWHHHHMITISKDRYIHVLSLLEPMIFTDSDIHINYHTDDLKQLRIFGDIFAVYCCDNTITLWKMKVVMKPSFHLKVTFLQSIIGPEDYIFSIGIWHDEVYCIANSGKLKVTCVNENEWIEKKYFRNSYREGGDESIISITAAHVYRERTVIMLTSEGKIIVSVNENCNKCCYLMQSLQTIPVSIALYGTVFALGGENGKLFLFHVESENDLSCLDFSRPHLTLSLSEASIISIDISYHPDSPVIAASTTESVHIVKWYKSHASHQKLKKMEHFKLPY